MRKAIVYLFALFILIFPSNVLARNYGEGSYGLGNYNEGEPTPTPTTAPASSSSTNSTSGSSSTSVCSDASPGTQASWLYGAIAESGSSIRLYFTEASEPVTKYVLGYGTKSGEYQYGVQDMGVNERHQMTYHVNSLSPNTTYYFKMRAQNGCATGNWSNEISAKTKGVISFNQLDFTESEIAYSEIAETEEDGKSEGLEVNVKVIDTQKQPVKGAKVTLHSDPKEAITDENGIATFSGVEEGEHKVLIAYQNYEGEQSIYLTATETQKEFNINVTIEPINVLLSIQVTIIIGVFALIIMTLLILLLKRSRRTCPPTAPAAG